MEHQHRYDFEICPICCLCVCSFAFQFNVRISLSFFFSGHFSNLYGQIVALKARKQKKVRGKMQILYCSFRMPFVSMLSTKSSHCILLNLCFSAMFCIYSVTFMFQCSICISVISIVFQCNILYLCSHIDASLQYSYGFSHIWINSTYWCFAKLSCELVLVQNFSIAEKVSHSNHK